MESKDKKVLTLLLIILIVVIAGIIGYIGFEVINENVKQGNSEEITDEFDNMIPTISEEELENDEGIQLDDQNENNDNSGTEQGSTSSGTTQGSTGGTSTSRKYSSSGVSVSGYWVAGTIRIPATGIRYSIFTDQSRKALDRGVIILYTTNGLNKAGNTVIAGHNYRSRLFFSKNKNLKEGDKIIIKDTSGLEITYSIYSKFVTNSGDASFYQRDTAGKREITLTTCTDQGTTTGERLIILAKEI